MDTVGHPQFKAGMPEFIECDGEHGQLPTADAMLPTKLGSLAGACGYCSVLGRA